MGGKVRRDETVFWEGVREGEAVETQVWPNYALNCKYVDDTRHIAINEKYDHINAMLVKMSLNPENRYYFWLNK